MSKSRPISFGDFLRASEKLGAQDPAARKRIAALLGFDWIESAPLPSEGRLKTKEPAPSARPLEEAASDAVTPDSPASEVAPVFVEEGANEVGDIWVEALPPRSVHMPKWMSEVEPMPPPASEERDEPPAVEPLFTPEWTRAILFAVLAHVDRRGAIDIERTVELLCRYKPLTRLPRRTKFHLKNDLQLLIDVNRTMDPFAQDQIALVEAVKRLVSEQNVEQLLFSVCPTRGAGAGGEWPWGPYRPPKHPGTLVMVITDLGVSRAARGVETASTDEWLRFAGMIRKDSCQLVTLVPFPLRRVPAALRRAMVVIPWDRSTTAGVIKKIRLTGRQGFDE